MAASIEERNRILRLIESGQVSAAEGFATAGYVGGQGRQVRIVS